MARDFETGLTRCIVGNNGPTSVLMKYICSFLLPTEGEVNINGKHTGKGVDFRPISALLSRRV